MKALCWILPHNWEENYRITAKSGPKSGGTLVFYKCSRCGKIKMDFKANVTLDASSNNDSNIRVTASEVELSPSSTRALNEMADKDYENESENKTTRRSKKV